MDPRYPQQGYYPHQPTSTYNASTSSDRDRSEEELLQAPATSTPTAYYTSTPPTSRTSPLMSTTSTTSYNEYYAAPSTAVGSGGGLRQRRSQFPPSDPTYAYYDNDTYTREGSSSSSSKVKASTRKMVRNLDIFTKVEKDMTIKTERGGMITVISYCIMAILILAEFITWKAQNSYPIEHVVVETS